MMNHRIMSSSAGFASVNSLLHHPSKLTHLKMDPQIRKSNISEEIEKYKLMKTQGLLNTVQSEKTSKNQSYLAHSNSLEQFLHTSPEEMRLNIVFSCLIFYRIFLFKCFFSTSSAIDQQKYKRIPAKSFVTTCFNHKLSYWIFNHSVTSRSSSSLSK